MCIDTFNEHICSKKWYTWMFTPDFYVSWYWTCALVDNTVQNLKGRDADDYIILESVVQTVDPFKKTWKTFTVDCLCYFCTFILPYWQHIAGCKLMWSISKSGPKLCQIKDPTSTEPVSLPEVFSSGTFIVLIIPCVIIAAAVHISQNTFFIAVKYAV